MMGLMSHPDTSVTIMQHSATSQKSENPFCSMEKTSNHTVTLFLQFQLLHCDSDNESNHMLHDEMEIMHICT
jgi:hypothetical protein